MTQPQNGHLSVESRAPYSRDAEQAVIGALILDGTQYGEVAAVLPGPDAFFDRRHRQLYTAIGDLVGGRRSTDMISLRERLQQMGELDSSGSVEYLAELMDAVTSTNHTASHAAIVRQYWERREVVRVARELAMLASDPEQPLGDLVARGVDAMLRSSAPTGSRSARSVASFLVEIQEDLEAQVKRQSCLTGIPSDIGALDRMTRGWQKGTVVVVGARPGEGKTSFGLHCTSVAVLQGPVYFVSREMSTKALLKRLVQSIARVNFFEIRDREQLDRDIEKIRDAQGEITTWAVKFDRDSKTPSQMRLGIERYQQERGKAVSLVVVDYVTLLKSDRPNDNKVVEVGDISMALHDAAVDLDLPVMELSQLDRAVDKGGRKRPPTMSDLRWSGQLEQDADVIALLHQATHDQAASGDMDIDLAKHREGPVGLVRAHWDRPTGTWRDRIASSGGRSG